MSQVDMQTQYWEVYVMQTQYWEFSVVAPNAEECGEVFRLLQGRLCLRSTAHFTTSVHFQCVLEGCFELRRKTSKINAMRNIVPWYMHIAPIEDRDTYDNIENQYGRRFESIQFDA